MKKFLMSSLLALSLLAFTGCDNPISAMITDQTSNKQDIVLDTEDIIPIHIGETQLNPVPSPTLFPTIAPSPTPELPVTPSPKVTPTPINNKRTPTPKPSPSIGTPPVNAVTDDTIAPNNPVSTTTPSTTPVPWNTPTPTPTPSEQYQIDDLNFQYYDYTKEIGFTESIMEYKDHTAYSINYPVIGIATIDEDILSIIYNEMNAFDQEYNAYVSTSDSDKAILHIDYTSNLVGKYYASIAIYMEHYSPTLAHPTEAIITRFYNLQTGQSLGLRDLVKESYLFTLSGQVQAYFKEDTTYSDGILWDSFPKNTAPTWNNFNKFTLTNDAITFYFDKYSLLSGVYGQPTVTLEIKELQSNLQLDLSGTMDKPDNPLTVVEEGMNDTQPIETIRVIDPTKPMIALTFDDGPEPAVTNRILDALDANQGKATFFVLGSLVSSHPEVLQRIVTTDNELGNHSYAHPDLARLSLKEAKKEVKKTNQLIVKITGVEPIFVRPPYGSYSPDMVDGLHQKMALWSVDTLDWKTKNKEKIIEEALNNVKDGSIILMHDIYHASADAAEYLIPELTKLGYQLVTLSELLEHRGDSIITEPVLIGKR